MLSAPESDTVPAIVELRDWFQTPMGRYVQEWEQARLDSVVEDAFGYVAVQVGFPVYDGLRNNRIPFHAYVGEEIPHGELAAGWHNLVVARPESLPLASQSVDLLVLPHVLEYAADPHAVLREAERVLMPEGRLIILGFNPWSLWGARQRLGRHDWLPTTGRFIGLPRLKDWLKLLSFELDRGHFGCYALPLSGPAWLRRFAFLDKAGDRWWPVAGAVYLVAGVKRVHGMRLVGPTWKKKRRRLRGRAQMAVNRDKFIFPLLRHDR